MSTGRPSARRLEQSLLFVAILAFGYCAWDRIDSSVYQRLQGRRLEALLGGVLGGRAEASGMEIATAARDEAISSGLIGRVEIPRIGISAVIAEGTGPGTLRRAVGHVPGTAFPGERGNVVLAGHRDSFFSGLGGIRPGDAVRIRTPDGAFEYRVDSKQVVGADQTGVLSATPSPTLTLITCFPFRYLGPAPDRFIVRARPVTSAWSSSPTESR